MRNVNIITMKAAHDFASKGAKSSKLAELQELCYPKRPAKQHWTFFGSREVIRNCYL